jgi:hypothetical protein
VRLCLPSRTSVRPRVRGLPPPIADDRVVERTTRSLPAGSFPVCFQRRITAKTTLRTPRATESDPNTIPSQVAVLIAELG